MKASWRPVAANVGKVLFHEAVEPECVADALAQHTELFGLQIAIGQTQ